MFSGSVTLSQISSLLFLSVKFGDIMSAQMANNSDKPARESLWNRFLRALKIKSKAPNEKSGKLLENNGEWFPYLLIHCRIWVLSLFGHMHAWNLPYSVNYLLQTSLNLISRILNILFQIGGSRKPSALLFRMDAIFDFLFIR